MWSLEQHIATWSGQRCEALVDLARPDRGLCQFTVDGQPVSGHLLGAHWGDGLESSDVESSPLIPLDAYVRQADVVASYPQLDLCDVRPQVYWRAIADADGRSGFELWLSMQSDQLDSRPQARLSIALANAGWFRVTERGLAEVRGTRQPSPGAPEGLLVRPHDRTWSLFTGLAWSDYLGLSIDPTAGCASFPVFDRSLEKGVIRRAVARAVLLDRGHDADQALRTWRELAELTPPLTT